KNVNSIRYVRQVVDYEARRQIQVLEAGGEIDQETRLFDVKTGETRTMRSKENAHDYRYFPDPDLLPLELSDEMVEGVKASMPELPDEKKRRFAKDFGLSPYDASVLAMDREKADYFEEVATGRDGKLASNWVTTELFGVLNKKDLEIADSPITAEQLGGLIDLIQDKTISGKIAKTVFEVMLEEGGDPADIVEARGLKQVTDTGAIEAAVDKVIAANPDQVAKVKDKPKTLGWFVGQVMKETGGKANPQAVNEILRAKLGVE
ncbi:MAG: Asp-tRNA(Asn)/Glu-tRNA(Gln) amidotransferase GatCAB subunit B, partial [Pseudomonadota bacterium]